MSTYEFTRSVTLRVRAKNRVCHLYRNTTTGLLHVVQLLPDGSPRWHVPFEGTLTTVMPRDVALLRRESRIPRLYGPGTAKSAHPYYLQRDTHGYSARHVRRLAAAAN